MFKFGQRYIHETPLNEFGNPIHERRMVFRINVGNIDSVDIEQYIRRIRGEFNLPLPRNFFIPVSDV